MRRLALVTTIALALAAVGTAHERVPFDAPGAYVSVAVELDGRSAPLYPAPDGSGRYYLEARPGARYEVRIASRSSERLGVRLTVDGLNAISGERDETRWWEGRRPGRMYVLDPWGSTVVRGWRYTVGDVFARAFGENEALKWALAANLAYYHDDPETLWWIFFAVAQGGYLASGGRYVRGGSQRLSEALAAKIEAAGGEIRTGRIATEIRLDADGRPAIVVHTDKRGNDRAEAATRAVAGNAAPAVLGEMLAEPARGRFLAAYGGRRLSISLFSIMLGLSRRPGEFGVRSYSNFLLPRWMTRLTDFRQCAGFLGAAAAGAPAPLLTVVDYSAIDSGFEGPPYPVSVVGLDRVENWAGLDKADHDARRKQWLDRIVGIIDGEFPGFGSHVVASQFSTAHSIARYLNAPRGAIYGFAPLPPTGPIWRGPGRSARTPIPGLYLASAYASSGGFTGAIMGGAAAADRILAAR